MWGHEEWLKVGRWLEPWGDEKWRTADRDISDSERLLDMDFKVARWQNLIPSFPWNALGWRASGRNPRDQTLQRSGAEQ